MHARGLGGFVVVLFCYWIITGPDVVGLDESVLLALITTYGGTYRLRSSKLPRAASFFV